MLNTALCTQPRIRVQDANLVPKLEFAQISTQNCWPRKDSRACALRQRIGFDGEFEACPLRICTQPARLAHCRDSPLAPCAAGVAVSAELDFIFSLDLTSIQSPTRHLPSSPMLSLQVCVPSKPPPARCILISSSSASVVLPQTHFFLSSPMSQSRSSATAYNTYVLTYLIGTQLTPIQYYIRYQAGQTTSPSIDKLTPPSIEPGFFVPCLFLCLYLLLDSASGVCDGTIFSNLAPYLGQRRKSSKELTAFGLFNLISAHGSMVSGSRLRQNTMFRI